MHHIINITFGTCFIYMLINKLLNYINKTDRNIYVTVTHIIMSYTICECLLIYLDKNIVTEFILLFSVTRISYSALYQIMNMYIPTFNTIDPEHKKCM